MNKLYKQFAGQTVKDQLVYKFYRLWFAAIASFWFGVQSTFRAVVSVCHCCPRPPSRCRLPGTRRWWTLVAPDGIRTDCTDKYTCVHNRHWLTLLLPERIRADHTKRTSSSEVQQESAASKSEFWVTLWAIVFRQICWATQESDRLIVGWCFRTLLKFCLFSTSSLSLETFKEKRQWLSRPMNQEETCVRYVCWALVMVSVSRSALDKRDIQMTSALASIMAALVIWLPHWLASNKLGKMAVLSWKVVGGGSSSGNADI